ncbi:MAG: hypothetical protein V1746_08170 [bacterium]
MLKPNKTKIVRKIKDFLDWLGRAQTLVSCLGGVGVMISPIFMCSISNYALDLFWDWIPYSAFFAFFIGYVGVLAIQIICKLKNNIPARYSKKFPETYFKIRINKKGEDICIEPETSDMANINYFEVFEKVKLSDEEGKQVILIALSFINPIYNTPYPTLLVEGISCENPSWKWVSHHTSDNFMHHIVVLISTKNLVCRDGSYLIKVKENESKKSNRTK